MKEIKLGGKNGGTALVSEEDYELISKYKWYLNREGYASGFVDKKAWRMHRFIIKPSQDQQVDHINRIKTDNRRTNLRSLSREKNNENKGKSKIFSSKYFGTFLIRGKYQANIVHNGKLLYLGRYDTEIAAAERRDMYIVHNNIGHIELNFPNKKEEYKNTPYIENKVQNPKTSQYIGVYKRKTFYYAHIKVNNKKIAIGKTQNEYDSACMYDNYIITNKIPNKKLNFPEKFNKNNKHIKITYETIENNNTTIKLIIPNPLNKSIIIDKSDYDLIKYYTCRITTTGYVYVSIGRKHKALHRVLMNVTDPKIYVDHIDGNPLNNKRNNLRLSDSTKNAQNKSKFSGDFTSKYIGIYYKPKEKKWYGSIRSDYKKLYCNSDISEEFAARRRDVFILENLQHTDFKPNFTWTPEEIIEWKIKLDYKKKKTSEYIGVSYHTARKIYTSEIVLNKKMIFCKRHIDETLLARMRDIFILENHKGSKLKLNFKWTPEEIKEWKEKLNQ
jgi:hypothetical protein